ncbi:MAG: fumarylacetoacetase, partial [Acidobacteria bacterium]
MYEINETHDPNLKSWVESANDPNTDFPIQNLPFCIAESYDNTWYVERAVRIGDQLLNLKWAVRQGLFDMPIFHGGSVLENVVSASGLSGLMGLTDLELRSLRKRLVEILSFSADAETKAAAQECLMPADGQDLDFFRTGIGDYTDFYCSIYHATNVGSMFRPDNPLLPNYKYVPIGYHGRASSIVISGTDIKRPHGQNRSDAEKPPVFIPCKNLDYEMELGFFVGQGNELGKSIPLSEAEQHIFGVCLVNDWSARDIQAWEYQPLGPFLAKNFATTVSPYVVTMEALAPFRTKAFERDPDDPQPLEYLANEQNEKLGGLDINLEVYIQTE